MYSKLGDWMKSIRSVQRIPSQYLDITHENFYMDNYLYCFSSEESTIDTIQKVVSILANGGFRLNKWLSNNKTLVQKIIFMSLNPMGFHHIFYSWYLKNPIHTTPVILKIFQNTIAELTHLKTPFFHGPFVSGINLI